MAIHFGKRTALGFCLVGLAMCSPEDPVPEKKHLYEQIFESINPMIGTGGLGFSVGSISPGPRVPFGLANPSPDTSQNGGRQPGFSHCAGYYFEDDEIRAFSQIHLSGTGVPDYGALGLMPTINSIGDSLQESDYRAQLDHKLEKVELGHYEVTLAKQQIRIGVYADQNLAQYRINYPQTAQEKNLVLNLAHGIGDGKTTDSEITVSSNGREFFGYVQHEGGLSRRHGGFRLYFHGRTPESALVPQLYSAGKPLPVTKTSTRGKDIAVVFSYDANVTDLAVDIGLSMTTQGKAKSALGASPGPGVAAPAHNAAEDWQDIIFKSAYLVGEKQDGTGHPFAEFKAPAQTFYSALYRVMHMPTQLSQDGSFPGFDAQSGYYRTDSELYQRAESGESDAYYSDFSLWDTFRTVHPLLSLVQPEVQEAMNRSILAMWEAGGHLPRWPLADGYTWTMLGNHGESMLIDAILRGAGEKSIHQEELLKRLVQTATSAVTSNGSTRSGRECLDDYQELGYCPLESGGGSVSRTLENSYNDWMLANLARKLGREDLAKTFEQRAGSWKNHFDPETNLLRPKHRDGRFMEEFDEEVFEGPYIEGNARQYTLYVPHHALELAELMGGKDTLVSWLETMFESEAAREDTILPSSWYWHGNEPCIHAAYMFAELGRPDLTAKWVRWIMDYRYGNGPDGLAGNDDGGTLSAWYVWSALGLYPIAGSDKYIIGMPRFPEVHLSSGLVIKADGWHPSRPQQVNKLLIDGEAVNGPYITHEQLSKARRLTFGLIDL